MGLPQERSLGLLGEEFYRRRDLDCYDNAMVAALATVFEPCPGHECA